MKFMNGSVYHFPVLGFRWTMHSPEFFAEIYFFIKRMREGKIYFLTTWL